MTSRQRAQELIEAGKVIVAGAPALKRSRLVGPGEAITLVAAPSPFVGRGGLKLEAALERYGIDVTGKRALDAGSSRG
ncbi:MAG: hypothetical protein N2037_13390, partial [Acidimicrobiales bacterium]|nr:hypothetical protein [Acidimicrobiales bacterium]